MRALSCFTREECAFAKLASTPGGMASICSCIGMWRTAGSWCG
jgi:hypothetical protein